MKKSNSDRKTELLRRLRDRMAALAAGPILRHAIVYIPDPDERGVDDLQSPEGAMPVGPMSNLDRMVVPTMQSTRIDTRRVGSNKACVKIETMKPETRELIWSDEDNGRRALRTAERWQKIAKGLWACLPPEEWEPFRVAPEIGPSLGASKMACDWGRLVHMAAWSGLVPGLRATIRRFNTLYPDRGWCRFTDEETGSPADDFIVTPILPGVPVEFAPSTYYASILHYDAVGDSLALIDHLLTSTETPNDDNGPARTPAEWAFLQAAYEAGSAMMGADLAAKAGFDSYKTACGNLCKRGDLEKPSPRGGYRITNRGKMAFQKFRGDPAPKNP